MLRKAEISRKTSETSVSLSFNIDGSGKAGIDTGIGFLNHMLNLFTRHGFFDLDIKAAGDLEVDAHHTVEDVGIVLGQSIKEAAGDKKSIKRYGMSYLPMDEALAMAVLDFSGRPYLVFDVKFSDDMTGTMNTQLFEEFFRALCIHAGLTLHMKVEYGKNTHHMMEALFKALGRALRQALEVVSEDIPSTKGMLD
jgi:imidazoleglycerol-phosphate dehydratase